MRRSADNVDWQQRAQEFEPGDIVVPEGFLQSQAGRVTAVWPAIGMIDVEMPSGNTRWPVEELQRIVEGDEDPPHTDSTPGAPSVERVLKAHQKMSLYWASKDRQYKMTNKESQEGAPCCPRCEAGPLSRTVYKRRDGSSERLLGCKGCLFLIKPQDIINHPVNSEVV